MLKADVLIFVPSCYIWRNGVKIHSALASANLKITFLEMRITMQRLIIRNMLKYSFSSLRLHYRFCYTEGVNNSFLESIWNSWAFGDLDYAQKALQSYFSSQVWERFPVLSVVLLQQTNAAFCQGSIAFFFFFFVKSCSAIICQQSHSIF